MEVCLHARGLNSQIATACNNRNELIQKHFIPNRGTTNENRPDYGAVLLQIVKDQLA